eukprot:6192447-Pleurochrysis_carterae.AAC.5
MLKCAREHDLLLKQHGAQLTKHNDSRLDSMWMCGAHRPKAYIPKPISCECNKLLIGDRDYSGAIKQIYKWKITRDVSLTLRLLAESAPRKQNDAKKERT